MLLLISQINNLTLQLNPKPAEGGNNKDQSRDFNNREQKNITEEKSKTKSWFFEKINKIDKSSATLTKKEKETQISNIRYESGDATANHIEIKS